MTPSIIDIKDRTEIDQKIKESDLVVIDFWAPWCGPCKRMDSILKEVVEEMKQKLSICKVNIDDHSDLAAHHRVASIPTFILFAKGEQVDKKIGSMDKDTFIQWIQTYCVHSS